MKNQRGFAHIFLILFLLAGLAVAVYLVQQKTNIFPKAYDSLSGPISGPITLPVEPINLSGSCDGKYAYFVWDAGNQAPTIYYLRLLKPEGGWWPNTASAGYTPVTFHPYKAYPGQKYNAWGVYACNPGGCSDFVKGPAFECPLYGSDVINSIDYGDKLRKYNDSSLPSWASEVPAPPIPIE